MNRIRDSIHALLSRSSRKDLKSDVTAVGRIREAQPQSPTFSGSQSRSGGRKNSAPGAGFNVFQTRIYTKGERNDYHYSPVAVIILPTFRVDPPDNIPFRLSVAELERFQPRIVAAPARDELRKPPLTIDTRPAIISKNVPPSPPISPGGQAAQGPLPTGEYQYESPTRAPPSPPITPGLKCNSPFIEASDDILIHIFSHLDSLPSMESLSLAHPRFHTVLASNKLFILRGIINNISAPASTLVELSKPSGAHTAKSYSESYASSIDVVHTIKALIQSRCRFFLTSGKMDFLNDRAERAFDDALYNIWIFCTLFRDRRESAERQMEWLRGFGSMELLDILEIWQCLGVLLRPLAESTELARKYGIIQSRLPVNDSEVILELEEWVSYVQTRGLDTLLPIVEWAEAEHTQRYTIVVGKGLNRWRRQHKTPYSLFLKDTASKVYRELSLAEKPKRVNTSPVGSWGPTTDF